MKNYIDLANKIIEHGDIQQTRTGQTHSLTGQMLEFDLKKGFPLLTTKYVNFEHILHETIWYLLGTDKINYLHEHNIHIWDNWADKNNSIGKTYGYQWRKFNDNSVLGDQWSAALSMLINDKTSRRIMINGWNPLQLSEMNLPPCIVNLHFIVRSDNDLDLIVYQRSADYCIGVPYDIAEMALLLTIMANDAGLVPNKLTIMYGDVHMYDNHIDTFLRQQASNPTLYLPKLKMLDSGDINTYYVEDYKHSGAIKYKIAV